MVYSVGDIVGDYTVIGTEPKENHYVVKDSNFGMTRISEGDLIHIDSCKPAKVSMGVHQSVGQANVTMGSGFVFPLSGSFITNSGPAYNFNVSGNYSYNMGVDEAYPDDLDENYILKEIKAFKQMVADLVIQNRELSQKIEELEEKLDDLTE